jgi:hypothetical protein
MWQKLADLPVRGKDDVMTCVRCRGLLLAERLETAEGRLFMVRCLNCGFASDVTMRHHRLHRPEPRRQISEKSNRARR